MQWHILAETQPAIPPAIIAALVSAIIALVVCYVTGRGNDSRLLVGMVQKIIEFSMTYPYLEDDNFCVNWPKCHEDEEKVQRYDNYCCHVFNTLALAWRHTQGDYTEMKRIIYPDELIVRHRKWWIGDSHNQSAYEPEFRAFVKEVLSRHSGDSNR